jgi:hypothetical protein
MAPVEGVPHNGRSRPGITAKTGIEKSIDSKSAENLLPAGIGMGFFLIV